MHHKLTGCQLQCHVVAQETSPFARLTHLFLSIRNQKHVGSPVESIEVNMLQAYFYIKDIQTPIITCAVIQLFSIGTSFRLKQPKMVLEKISCGLDGNPTLV